MATPRRKETVKPVESGDVERRREGLEREAARDEDDHPQDSSRDASVYEEASSQRDGPPTHRATRRPH